MYYGDLAHEVRVGECYMWCLYVVLMCGAYMWCLHVVC